MPKRDSAERLVKRIKKIERAQDRLNDIKARILTQSDSLAELLETARGMVNDNGAAGRAVSRARPAKRTRAATRASGTARSTSRATRSL